MKYLLALTIAFAVLLPATAARASSDSLFVLLGGYNSCYQTTGGEAWPFHSLIWQKFQSDILPAIQKETGVAPKYLNACYGISAKNPVSYFVSFRFLSSWNPDEQDVFASPLLGETSYQDFSNVINTIVDTVETTSSMLADPKIYFIGHSYGGWTSIQSALKLLDHGVSLAGVYTIDPISPPNCNTLGYLKNLTAIPGGCQEAPSDISSEDRARLRDELDGRWLNFYETDHLILHSGPIPELRDGVEEFHFAIPSIAPLLSDQHTALATDPRVWKLIQEGVSR